MTEGQHESPKFAVSLGFSHRPGQGLRQTDIQDTDQRTAFWWYKPEASEQLSPEKGRKATIPPQKGAFTGCGKGREPHYLRAQGATLQLGGGAVEEGTGTHLVPD